MSDPDEPRIEAGAVSATGRTNPSESKLPAGPENPEDSAANVIGKFERAGKLAEAREYACAAARAAEAAGESETEATLLAKASELALYTQGAKEAEKLALAACARAPVEWLADAAGGKSAGDTRVAAAVEARLALARAHLRIHTDSALDDAQAALDEIVECGARHQRATRLKLRGLVNARRGRPRLALSDFESAYRMADGYPALRARVLLTRAVQLRNWGLFDDAQRFAERSLEIRLQLGDLYGAALCYGTLAFIYQRQGLWERERDALVADLRLCERIGGKADMPGLRARLAGALVGMGKYAGAWTEACAALELERVRMDDAGSRMPATEEGRESSGRTSEDVDEGRIGVGLDIDIADATRVCAFAWRELARVCLAQGRLELGMNLVQRAHSTFERVRDGYGQALCRMTEGHLALARAQAAAGRGDRAGMSAACEQLAAAIDAAQPTFIRLGAVPEAAESILLHVDSEHLQGRGERAADMLEQQVLPMLQQAGLGGTTLYRTTRETLRRIAPDRAIARTVTRAAMLRSLTAIMTERDAQPGTAVTALIDSEDEARAFALSVIDRGGVMLWPDSQCALAIILGPEHEERAGALIEAYGSLPLHAVSGLIDLEHMWPAGLRARGEPVEQALRALRGD